MADKMIAELDRLSVQELTTLIEAAEGKRREKQEEAKASMVARWKAEAAAAGLSIEALLAAGAGGSESGNGRKARKSQGVKVAPKFRGPNGEEWTGRGKPPKWLTVLEAEGKSRSEFKI